MLAVAIGISSGAVVTAMQQRPDRLPALTLEMLELLPSLPGEIDSLPAVPEPADNPTTNDKVALGMRLFFDKSLSRDRSMSCATCHDPAKGYGDGLPRASGFGKQELKRHSPTLLNAAYNEPQFWDGRASGLEEQALGPILAAAEMNMPSTSEVVKRINESSAYDGRFEQVFGEPASMENIAKAIAAFERTLVTPDSPFDRYMAGDKAALTEQEKRGLALFVGKGSCSQCHTGPNFTDNKFHSLGGRQEGPPGNDLGRQEVTGDPADREAFKTPTLRNVSLTGPYMHDGSLSTLEEVVDYYNGGGGASETKSELIFELQLGDEESADLVAFLNALTGRQPALPETFASTEQP